MPELDTSQFKKIPLSQGKYAIVDAGDYDFLNQFKWCYFNAGYAGRNQYMGGGRKNQVAKAIYMHRLVTSALVGMDVDHINGNGLDNRKENLRVVTHAENLMNSKSRGGTSKFKGVYWNVRDNIWVARITKNYKGIHIGYFKTEIEAAMAYDQKAKELFGEIATLNFN